MNQPNPAETPPLPDSSHDDADRLVSELQESLQDLEHERREQPYLNPVLLQAHRISRQLADGTVDRAALTAAVQALSLDGFALRAERIAGYLGETAPGKNREKLTSLFRALAITADGHPIGFADFQARLGRTSIGAVITAHPTFNLPPDMMVALSELASGHGGDGVALSPVQREKCLDVARDQPHRPELMTLESEHALSLVAITNLSVALREVYNAAFEVAEDLYPDVWTALRPTLMSVASWVGYDLDGRSDVGWIDSLLARMRGRRTRLELLGANIDEIRAEFGASMPTVAAQALAAVGGRIDSALSSSREEIEAFAAATQEPDTAQARIQDVSRRIVEGRERRLVDATRLTELLGPAIDAAPPALARKIAVLRAEMDNAGLNMAHVHMRVNAVQLHNSIRSRTGLESNPDDPRVRQTFLNRMDTLLDDVTLETINFGSILTEKASARRLLMVAAQILKFFDPSRPLRFLIAECETAFTPLAALYFAKMLGVDTRIDISPLFETRRALEVGTRMLDTLLANRHYRAYVERRGRICVQVGYSDAGRYLGQIPAAASIERFKFRLVKVLQKHGLDHLELIVFDTHGESVGRGGQPSSLAEALTYADPPAVRRAYTAAGIAVTEEVSFQGGDGWLYFLAPAAALAAVTRMLEHSLVVPDETPDPYYIESDTIRELFTVISEFQRELAADPDYGTLLGTFAPNFTYPAGSRTSTRQQHGRQPARRIRYARELRAIPQNAALQQLGLLANSFGGVGGALSRAPQQFAALYQSSPRLRLLAGIAEYAVTATNFDAAHAYVESLNPGLWLLRAGGAKDWQMSARYREIADLLEPGEDHDGQDRIVRRLFADHLLLIEGMKEVTPDGSWPTTAPQIPHNSRRAIALLHAIRVALIHEIFALASQVPNFAPQQGTTHRETVLRLLHLDVPGAMSVLRKIFRDQPAAAPTAEDFGEPATYRGSEHRTYRLLHDEVFAPLEENHELLLRVGTAITQYIGFFG